MNTKSDLRSPLQRARGLGSAREGVAHWWLQRLTAVALFFLVLWFVATVLSLLHVDYASARAAIAQPWNAVLMIAFTSVLFWHMQLGLEVIIEDYVHATWLEISLKVVIKFLAAIFALACAVAVLRITFGG